MSKRSEQNQIRSEFIERVPVHVLFTQMSSSSNCITCELTVNYRESDEDSECQIVGDLECLDGDEAENLELQKWFDNDPK